MTFVTFRHKNKTVEHCFTSMCCFLNTWLKGMTPLNAYTLTQTRTHTHSLVTPCLVILPGKIALYVENLQRSGHRHKHARAHTLSPPRPTTLHTHSSLLSRAAWLAILSLRQLRGHLDVCVRKNTHVHTHTHAEDHVYIDGSGHQGLCSIPLLLRPSPVTCFFHFL